MNYKYHSKRQQVIQKLDVVAFNLIQTMKKTRESIALTHPHDAYRRFKEDEYLPLDERVEKIDESCEKRLMLARKG